MRKWLLLIIVMVAALGLSCSSRQSPSNSDSAIEPAPGHGVAALPSLQPFLSPEYPSYDAIDMYDWPDYLPSVHDTSYDIYAVTLVWGHTFNTAEPNPDTTDWTGTLRINFEGFAEAFEAISFEPGVDSIIPVDAPVWVPWISETHGDDFDGVTVIVFYKRGIYYFAAPTLSIETGPFSTNLYVEELASLTRFYQVNEHNGVIIHSHRLPLDNFCQRGTIVGKWVQESNDRQQGSITAVWTSRNGTPQGHVFGSFSATAAGERTFTGWVTGIHTDNIIAYLAGDWWFDDSRMCPLCGSSHGLFSGTFAWADGSGNGGTLRGEFGSFELPPDETELPMSGEWKVDCTLLDHLEVDVGDNNSIK
ncbi:hypothetical protein KQH82_08970 [bacterium]|nr:hypothetical protein [bacterium]